MADVSKRAEQELAMLAQNATALYSAVGHQRNMSDVQLLNKLKNGKHKKIDPVRTLKILF